MGGGGRGGEDTRFIRFSWDFKIGLDCQGFEGPSVEKLAGTEVGRAGPVCVCGGEVNSRSSPLTALRPGHAGVTEWPLPWAYNEPLFLMQLESFGLVLFCTLQSGAWSGALTGVGLSPLTPHPGMASGAATFLLLCTLPCCNGSFHLVPGLRWALQHKCLSRVQHQWTT